MTPSMTKLTETFESTVLQWPHTEKRNMMGGLCYMVKGKMFSTIIDGLVITKLSDEERQELPKILQPNHSSIALESSRKGYTWILILKELQKVLLYIKKSYETALEQA